MARKLRVKSNIEPSRPDDSTLTSNILAGTAHDSGSNKSVWQTMVDNAGFAKKHPDIVQKGKRNAKSK